MNIIEIEQLTKTFRIGFFLKKIPVLQGVTFSVRQGEVFGLIGPNGAGKTTIIKILMGLLRKGQGKVNIFGHNAGSVKSRASVGYLPESPYFYEYLTARELLIFIGRLYGMKGSACRKRASELLERVGLDKVSSRPLRKFSKGMLQRTGLAQALMHDSELLILDEPQSGLDPIWRKEVRDIILQERDKGKTIFFSSHILADVETVCDRVGILFQGKIHDIGPLSQILSTKVLSTRITTLESSSTITSVKEATILEDRTSGGKRIISIDGDKGLNAFLKMLLGSGFEIVGVERHTENLEDVFFKKAESDLREESEEELPKETEEFTE